MQFLNNLKIRQKLFLTAGLMAIPIVVLLYLFISARNVAIDIARNESAGLEYLAPLRGMLERMTQHRTLSHALLNGDAEARPRLGALSSLIDADFNAARAADQKVAADWGTAKPLADLEAEWKTVRDRATSGSAKESFDQHTKVVSGVLRQIGLVGDKSALILDPELDTYYLANALLTQVTSAAEYLSQLNGYAAGVAAAGRVTPDDQAQLLFLVSQATTGADSLTTNMNSAFTYNALANTELAGLTQAAVNGSATLAKLTRDRMLQGRADATSREIQDAGAAALANFFALYDKTIGITRTTFGARIDKLNSQKYTQLSLAGFIVLFAFGLVYLVSRGITTQVGAIQQLFGHLGIGDFEARAKVTSQDELGGVATGLNSMLDNLLSLIQTRDERDRIQASILKLLDEVSGVAEGDLTKEAEVTAEVTGAIADSFNYMIVELRRIIAQVQQTTANVTASASGVRVAAEELAQQNQRQSVEILTASQTITTMAESIQEVSRTAGSAAEVAGEALATAKQGASSVSQTIDGMNSIRGQVQETAKRIKRLGESSQEIGEIIQLISDIADRTSILALNASIQAAMAGDAGKGFAVVAEEVERLAVRATESTKKVSTLVKSIQADTNEAIAAMEETTREVVGGSRLANEAGQRLTEIEQVSAQIATLVRTISESARRQAESTAQVAHGMSGISRETEKTAAGARQAAGEIAGLAGRANELRESLEHFRLPAAA